MSYTYPYPRPALTVDCVVFGVDDDQLKVLLIKRDNPPFEGQWALPGGYVNVTESLEEAARRELQEETGLELSYLEQLYTFGDVERDPSGRVVTVAYFALVKTLDHAPHAASDAREARFFPNAALPKLAFDHGHILSAARKRLQNKLRYEPIGFELLPRKFTLSRLQRLYEIILERPLDKRNFRKKLLSLGILRAQGELETGRAHRAAQLYRFDERRYRQLIKLGFQLEI
jgi:8-oxo-dGTP diphosphatase